MMGTFYPRNDYRNYLAHYGVKGMKWGVRHDKPSTGNKLTKRHRAQREHFGRHISKPKYSDNIEKNGWSIDKEYTDDNKITAEKVYKNNEKAPEVNAILMLYKNTPNKSIICENIDKINSHINRLRNEFADINYKNDKKETYLEGYPKDYAEQNKKAFSEASDIRIAYKDTRNYAPKYKRGIPDDLYEISMWSPVDGLEYVFPISQNEYGHFYIDPNHRPEYR